MRSIFLKCLILACCLPMTALADALFETGRNVFINQAQPSCSVCHALTDAGAEGEIGPNLNELKPTAEQVMNAVKGGVGIMPGFAESLSDDQIKAVSHYVSTASQQ